MNKDVADSSDSPTHFFFFTKIYKKDPA